MTARVTTNATGSKRRWDFEKRLATLLLAIGLDLLLGEPPNSVHPVVAIGNFVASLGRRAPKDGPRRQVAFGSGVVAVVILAVAAGSALAEWFVRAVPGLPRSIVIAILLKPSFSVRALFAAGEGVREPLARGDLASARRALRSLVSRPTDDLDPALVAAAAIESLAENASDSAVAPWLAYLVAGLPGAYVYRAVNTMDAMIGYRGRYEFLGKVAARLDDLLNFVPSRLTAGVVCAGAVVSGADARQAIAIATRDRVKTSSPNAGWPMSAMAGALGVQLEKVGHYQLGDPSRPVDHSDIARAATIVQRGLIAFVGGVIAIVAGERFFRRRIGGRA